MISGLFGTVISLERAVAFGKGWATWHPSCPRSEPSCCWRVRHHFGATFYLVAAGVLAIVSGLIMRVQPAVFTVALLFGAVSWGTGSLLWLAGDDIPSVVGWWIAFLLLTIAGERLEMSRLLPQPRGSQVLFVIPAALIVAGAGMGPR